MLSVWQRSSNNSRPSDNSTRERNTPQPCAAFGVPAFVVVCVVYLCGIVASTTYDATLCVMMLLVQQQRKRLARGVYWVRDG